VTGIVQGVGFRPHVYRVARQLGLTGSVWNDPAGATVRLYGDPDVIDSFVDALIKRPPPLARIDSVKRSPLDGAVPPTFEIAESRSDLERVCLVSPDVATCDDCLRELFDPSDFRYRYPYINCTNCGPRFTIIRDLPYDRPKTTMAAFPLCDRCASQYRDPADRRFHAQPVACERCGPNVRLGELRGLAAIREAAARLRRGEVVAVKGLGGYHLACDAVSQAAVTRLRSRKCREEKPLALMAASLLVAEKLVEMTERERDLLTSPARPIVLITARAGAAAPTVAPGNPRLGVMLPYTPLQHLLFAEGAPGALVMTSGNRTDEPICYTEEAAFERLSDIADAFLVGEREIHTRCDDSVVQVVGGEAQFLRRSRGYVPLPIQLPFDVHGILAVGAELKNTFAIGRGNSVFISHHIGDLKNLEEYEAFRAGIEQFQALVEVEPTQVVRDMHPLYLSTRYAEQRGLPVTAVQHHHAHVTSVMAEHQLQNQDVIGVAFDGTGYGDDGTSWGADFLIADYGAYRRVARFRNLPLAGGDTAIRQNWRSAAAYMLRFLPRDEVTGFLAERGIDPKAVGAVLSMLQREVGCAPASSAGRLFDAVASILGVRQEDSFEGQGAMEFEALAWGGTASGDYPFPAPDAEAPTVIDPTLAVEAIYRDIADGRPAADIAATFHRSLAALIVATCAGLAATTAIQVVCLSGGTFQNRFLSEQVMTALRDRGLTVLTNRLVPPNDGGIAVGQLATAAWRRLQCA
jgi:hydrogenase maturation protein HypF